MDLLNRLRQVVIVLLAKVGDTMLAIQTLSDHLVRLHKLIDLASKLVVLVANDSDMVVHRVDFDLQVCVVLQERTVRVTSTFQLLSHVKKLVLFLPDFDL